MTLPAKESDFQKVVIELAQRLGYRVAHFRPMQDHRGAWRTPVSADGKGFPDLVLVRERIIFAELKKDDRYPDPDQRAWLDALAGALDLADDEAPGDREHVLVRVWRPKDWPDIQRTLEGRN